MLILGSHTFIKTTCFKFILDLRLLHPVVEDNSSDRKMERESPRVCHWNLTERGILSRYRKQTNKVSYSYGYHWSISLITSRSANVSLTPISIVCSSRFKMEGPLTPKQVVQDSEFRSMACLEDKCIFLILVLLSSRWWLSHCRCSKVFLNAFLDIYLLTTG